MRFGSYLLVFGLVLLGIFLYGCLGVGEINSPQNLKYSTLESIGGQVVCTYSRHGTSGINNYYVVFDPHYIYAKSGDAETYIFDKYMLIKVRYKPEKNSKLRINLKCPWLRIERMDTDGIKANETIVGFLDRVSEEKSEPYSNLSCTYSRIGVITPPSCAMK